MSGRKIVLAGLAVALVLGSASRLGAQQTPYGTQEHNTCIAATDVQDPKERLQAIETCLQTYPQTVLRAFVYPKQFRTAWALKRYATVMKAVNDFLALDRDQVLALYKQWKYNDMQIDNVYYGGLVLYTFSFLQSFRNGTPNADLVAGKAAERARQGLELHEKIYRQVQPPAGAAERQQFEQRKRQAEAAFRSVLALVAWRQKDYNTAARQYGALVDYTPDNAAYNYYLGRALLQKEPRESERGLWYVARAVALGIRKSEEVKSYLLKNVATYQRVFPACSTRQVERLLAQARASAPPPPAWPLATAEEIDALRQDLTVKRIFDDLKVGGEQEELIWLASCGMEFPEMDGKVIEVSESADNLVTLRLAATQEAAEANTPNVEVKVAEPPEAKNLQAGDFIRFSGILSDYKSQPQFLVKLTGGKINPETIPKTRR
ncbi:MAG: hypothetical protein ACE5HL_06515 [Terriglobia bacterium]